jgi:hypothetical protein
MTDKEKFEYEARIKDLELQWQDHFHVRNQTWRALGVSMVFAVFIIGFDWFQDNAIFTIVSSILLAIIALLGMQVTIRHRNQSEIIKFRTIMELEKSLGIDSDHTVPHEIKWWHIFCIFKSNTSIYILRIQFVILVITVLNLIFNLN